MSVARRVLASAADGIPGAVRPCRKGAAWERGASKSVPRKMSECMMENWVAGAFRSRQYKQRLSLPEERGKRGGD